MKFATGFIALCIGISGASASFGVMAQTDASALSAVSAMPLASVVGASVGGVVAIPVAFSTAGAVLVVKAVEASAVSTVYALERISDGAKASIEVSAKAAGGVSTAVGAVVFVSVISTGVVLSVAGKVIAFIPNEIGKALLHNEKVSR